MFYDRQWRRQIYLFIKMVSKKSTNFAENCDTKTLFLLLKLPRQRAALNVSHLYCYNGQSGVNVQIHPPPPQLVNKSISQLTNY